MHSDADPRVPRVFLSVPDAVTASGLGRTTFYRLLKSGDIPTVKIGTRMLIPWSGLQAWAARLEAEQRGDPVERP
jgi:excisionase family DNA binding protein